MSLSVKGIFGQTCVIKALLLSKEVQTLYLRHGRAVRYSQDCMYV